MQCWDTDPLLDLTVYQSGKDVSWLLPPHPGKLIAGHLSKELCPMQQRLTSVGGKVDFLYVSVLDCDMQQQLWQHFLSLVLP